MQYHAKLLTSFTRAKPISLQKCDNAIRIRHFTATIHNPFVFRFSRWNKPSKYLFSKRTLVHTSRYAAVDIPNEDLFSFLTANFPYYKSKTVSVDAPTGKVCIYQQLHEGAISLGSALIKRGLQPNDVVGICAPNCVEFMMTMLAVPGVGASLSPINQSLNAQEMESQMVMSNAKFVIAAEECLPVVADAVSRTAGRIKDIFVIGESTCPSSLSFTSLLSDDGSAFPSEAERRAIIDPASHIAFIPYSSGTTGLPKGVELTHRNMVANVLQVSAHPDLVGPAADDARDRSLSLLPMWHSYMLLSSMVTMRFGTMFCIMPKFDPIIFLKSIAEHKLSFLPIVPPLGIFLLEYKDLVAKYDLTSVREIMFGAAPLGPDVHAEICERFKPAIIRQGYGMSELSPAATVVPASDARPGSAGVLIPNTEMKIVDINDRSVLGEGREGEVAIRGPQVMKGYLNNPQATADMIDSEGWLYTGDIGNVDNLGHLRIVDRLKELIKYKGHQVAPAELEDVLVSHPGIADAAVIGIPDEAAGEVPRAFVKLRAGCEVSEEEVIDFVNGRVSAFSWLRGGAEFVEAVPKAASGKILRRELREKFKNKSIAARD